MINLFRSNELKYQKVQNYRSIYDKPKGLIRAFTQELFLKTLFKLFPEKFSSYKSKIVLFGFQTIDEGETGVATIFGAVNDEQGLSPGLQISWPAPIGGFEVFKAENRSRCRLYCNADVFQ